MRSVDTLFSPRLLLLAFSCVMLLCVSCGSNLVGSGGANDDDSAAPLPLPDPCAGVAQTPGTSVRLEAIASGFSSPVHIAHAGDGSGRLFVVEQSGRIKALADNGAGTESTWLDISDRVRSGGERGLLSVAFHPEFTSNGRAFVYYTRSDGDVVISEFQVSGEPQSSAASASSERVLLVVDQPAGNHNGGQLVFGPDGYLYISVGDGGGAGDNFGNGQRKDTLLAKLLRIDVDSGDPYGIPADNPFVGDAQHRPETWAWGLRNAWRVSFDRQTGLMWIADVGQNAWEEIHIGVAGANYGWPEMEGNHCFNSGCDPSAFEPAVWEYPHSAGISITGGFVYRGCSMPDLQGLYFYSDYNYFDSPLWSLRWDGKQASEGPATLSSTGAFVSSFGEDESGELYLCDHAGGRILKMVPAGS
ncbi:MAG: glucose dehydrogenase [Rickettsiales bacterium]|nr:glucose dehydrogenase [Rickettsiales bacterium]